MHIFKSTIALLFSSSIFMPSFCYADLSISPVQLFITGERGQRSTTATFTTMGEKSDRTYELSVFRWTQDEQGNDVLTEDTDLVVNPKSLILKPESKRVIRFGFRQPIQAMNLKQEGSWRVRFHEIPSVLQQTGMNIAVNFSVPVFVGSGFKSDVKFRFGKDDKNETVLIAQNNGTAHFQITKFNIQDAEGKTLTEVDIMKYVLPQRQVFLPLKDYKPVAGQMAKLVMLKEGEAPVVFDIAEK